MTIWFHEGLPRSGKSYEAMVKHALPAIQAGRHVVSNIKGINPEKIALVLDIPVEEVESLITVIPWDNTLECWKFVKNDCLLLLDEVQDFWPATRERLGKEITELITQHGQRGLDIILMGQSNKDCHALWRRRIDKLIYFVQKDAIGKPNEYAWQLFKQVSPDKFAKVNGGGGKYEAKYFGVYSSHVDGTTNKAAYADSRANILSTPLYRFGFPAFGLVIIFAVWYLVHFLNTPIGAKSANAVPLVSSGVLAVNNPDVVNTVNSAVLPGGTIHPISPALVLEDYSPPPDYIETLLKDFRPRLAAVVQGREGKMLGKIEFFMPDGLHRREIMDFNSIRDFGWVIESKSFGVMLSKGSKRYSVTAWPIDIIGAVPQAVQSSGAITGKMESIN